MGSTMKDIDEFKGIDSCAGSCGVLRFVPVLLAALLCFVLFLCPMIAFAQISSDDLGSDDVHVNNVKPEGRADLTYSSQCQNIEASDFAINAVGQVSSLVALSSSPWMQNGTCEWMMDESTSTMRIRPLLGYTTGELDTLPWNPENISDSLQYLELEGRIALPATPDNGGYSSYFTNMHELREIQGIELLDTSKVTNMAGMFEACWSLTSIDISSFDTSNVTDMSGMFERCDSLTSVNLSGLDTSKVESIAGMFLCCSALTTIDLTGFSTSNVEAMGYLNFGAFMGCISLESLDISSFDTSNVLDFWDMFAGCKSLKTLDLSKFDTSNAEIMTGMFSGCNSLKDLNLSNFSTPKVQDMAYMFSGCESLTSLNVSNFDTRNVKRVFDMFAGCGSLERLDISSFNTMNVDECVDMFAEANKLSSISIGSSFTLQNTFPLGTWTNEKGESFSSFSIPRGTAGTYIRSELVPTPYAIVLGETEGETVVTVGCDPFWVSSGTSKFGIDGVRFTSEDPRIATVDKFGLVTVHSNGLNWIRADFGDGVNIEEGILYVEVESFPTTADSDIGAYLSACDSFSAHKLDGCSLRIKRSPLINEKSTINTIKAYMDESASVLDILDLDIIDSNGNVMKWNEPDHPIWIAFEENYLSDYFEPRWSWSIDFVYFENGKIEDELEGFWYRDVAGIDFMPTHLSTYAVVATPVSDDGIQNGALGEQASGSSNASQNGTRVSGDPKANKLAQTGDVLGFAVFAVVELIMIAVGFTLIARSRTSRSKER